MSDRSGTIPGLMGGGVALNIEKKIFAVGWRKERGSLNEVRLMFNGDEWGRF